MVGSGGGKGRRCERKQVIEEFNVIVVVVVVAPRLNAAGMGGHCEYKNVQQ